VVRDVHSDEVRAPALRLEGFEGEWSETTLGQVSYRSAEKNSDLTYGETFTNSAQNGVVSQLDYFDNQVSNAANVGGYYVVKPGDFVYNPRLSVTAPVGPLNRNDLGRTGIVSPLYTVFTLTGLDSDFTKWLFKGQTWHRYMQTAGDSGVRGDRLSISNADFFDMPLKAPSRGEQRLIGDYLNRVETLVDSTALRLTSLTSLKKTMLVKMFPQGTASTPEVRFEGFEGDWECEYLGNRAEVKSAARVHRHEWTTSGVPFFRASDVSAIANGISNPPAFISHELYENLVTRSGRLRKGDVLVVGGGSIGTPYVVPDDKPLYSKDADLLWVQSDRERLSPEYLATFFRSPSFQQYLRSISHAGTISHYTIVQAKNTPIPLPSLPEQQAIGSYFRSLDALIEAEQKKLTTLRNLKSALLTQMFV